MTHCKIIVKLYSIENVNEKIAEEVSKTTALFSKVENPEFFNKMEAIADHVEENIVKSVTEGVKTEVNVNLESDQ